MNLVKCPMCNKDISPNAINCPICGEPLKTQNTNHLNTINHQKNICLVCKGRGKVVSPIKIFISIIILLLIWTVGVYFVLYKDGQALGLIACTIVYGSWGFRRVKCKVCDGTGSVNL